MIRLTDPPAGWYSDVIGTATTKEADMPYTHHITGTDKPGNAEAEYDATVALMAEFVAEGARTQDEADANIARAADRRDRVVARRDAGERVQLSRHKSAAAAHKALAGAAARFPHMQDFKVEEVQA